MGLKMIPSIGIDIGLMLLFQTQLSFVSSAQDSFDDSSEFFALIIGISQYENESCGVDVDL